MGLEPDVLDAPNQRLELVPARADKSVIEAPSNAALPTFTIRSAGRSGTRPMRRAASTSMWRAKPPAR